MPNMPRMPRCQACEEHTLAVSGLHETSSSRDTSHRAAATLGRRVVELKSSGAWKEMMKTPGRSPVASGLCSPAATGLNQTMSRAWRRAADKRGGIASLISALATALPMTREPRVLRQRFEDELRERVRARVIGLRDSTSLATPPAGALTIDVTAGPFTLGAIDAVLNEGTALDEWDLQTLESARHLAALVLLLERAQRAGFCTMPRRRPDGAAPIIGSSPGMRAVRERMERIALTDFTVLIEGESGSGKELVARHIHELSPR